MLRSVQFLRTGIILLVIALPLFLWSQSSYSIQVKRLSAEDGLLGQRAKEISEDKNGLIWIATLDGLNRFDGYEFKWFNQSNSELNYANTMYGLPIDHEGYVWLNYEKKAVEFFNATSLEALTFAERFENAPVKGEDIRKVFASDVDGSILLQTWSGVRSYHIRNQEWILLSTMGTSQPAFFSKELIWYIQEGVLYKLDEKGRASKEFELGKNTTVDIDVSSEGVYKLFSFNTEKSELSVFDYQDNQFKESSITELTFLDKTLGNIDYNRALDKVILQTSNDLNQRKAYVFDPITKQMQAIPLDGYESLLHIDKKGVLWFNTLTDIAMVKINTSLFDVYPDVVASRGIWADDEYLVVSSEKSYPIIFSQKSKEKVGILEQDIFAFDHHNKDELWGIHGSAINHIDPESQDVIESIPRSSQFNFRTWAVLKDNSDRWWIGSEDRQIGRYDSSSNDSIQVFNQYNKYDYLRDILVIHLLEDGEYLWASSDKGLVLMHKEDGIIGHYYKGAEKAFNLPFEDVHFLHQDGDGVFWAATNYEGLVRFELNARKEVQSVKQYTRNDNLSSNVLYTIFEDSNERLWISTLNGISCFNKETEEVLTFTEFKSVNNEFNRTSGFQDADGQIYFGSMQGVVGFQPDNVIDKKTYDSDLFISQVQKYSSKTEQLFDYTKSTLETQTIVQEPWERYLRIDVGMADFFDARLLKYHYQIKGLHDDFRPFDGNRLQLSSLPYGNYDLRIKGQAADKRYSEDEIVLALRIIRPIYMRWWFLLLSSAALITIILAVYNIRLTRLTRQKEILEQTVADRTRKINEDKIVIEEQAEKLKTLDKLKDRFFTNISHELRTPLTLILAPLGTLLKSKNLSDKESSYTKLIQRHAKYLLKRINEIMELNQLEARKSKVNYFPTRFYDFVKVAVSNFESVAPQKNITFLFDYQMNKEIQVLIDKDKYEHIVYNFLSNAFKYTPENGSVEVSLHEVDNTILLKVRDSGIGISPDALPSVFDRFYQAENADKSGSSGIGLALCKELAEILDGEVWAESTLGKGSSFYFKMPFKEVLGVINDENAILNNSPSDALQENENMLESNPGDNSSRPKILLVEDNSDLRDYIKSFLAPLYEVQIAKNGKEAMEFLETNSEMGGRLPALILSDIMMPVMDGLELLETIKKLDGYRHIPMVMLTARKSKDAKLSALQLGVDDYITKPFNEEEVLIRIQNILENQAARLAFLQEVNSDTSAFIEITESLLNITESDQNWLGEVEQVVMKNLSNSQFTKALWSEEMLISERQLRRKIKELTGLTLTKYIQLARLSTARNILESGSKSTVSEVSYAVGFETPKYFSKLFYEEYGRKPVEYFE